MALNNPPTYNEGAQGQLRQQEVQTGTSPSRVFSILPFTILAYSGSLSTSKWAVTIGVLMVREALIISLMRGTPSVICDMLSRINHLQDAHYILSSPRTGYVYYTGMQELKELNSHCNLSDPCMAMPQPFIGTGIYTTAIIDYLHKQLPSKAGHISSHVMLITHVTAVMHVMSII